MKAWHTPAPSSTAVPDIQMMWGVKIPMRDGTLLNATIIKPRSQTGPLPVITTLTPYVSDTYYPRASYFAQNGYVFALVDVRGRGNSAGQFEPLVHDGPDGYDVVEWLAMQPFCNRKVGMWGGSYGGYDQWLTARECPPHLGTIVPAAAAEAGRDFPFVNGVPSPYLMRWITCTSGVTVQDTMTDDLAFWIAQYGALYFSHQAFDTLDQVCGNPSPWFQSVLGHSQLGAFWTPMRLEPQDYARIEIPILTITGHYDANLPAYADFGGDQTGALGYYRMHMKYGTATAKAAHHLLVGPWDHAGTRTPELAVGGLTFGPRSLVDMDALHKAWFDWIFKGGARPAFLEKRVTYYVVPADHWKYADQLDAVANGRLTFYLDSDGTANELFHAGRLRAEPAVQSPSDRYTYDPLDTRPGTLETPDFTNVLTDQRLVLNTFGNGVIYHSDPFAADTEITGVPSLSIWLGIDVPDTDFLVTIYEVLADGSSVLLAEDLLRARWRGLKEAPRLVRSTEPIQYDFPSMPFFSRLAVKGSRVRLFLRCPNSIYYQKNYNGGGAVETETARDARVAHVTVYHDAAHPSALVLPTVTHDSH